MSDFIEFHKIPITIIFCFFTIPVFISVPALASETARHAGTKLNIREIENDGKEDTRVFIFRNENGKILQKKTFEYHTYIKDFGIYQNKLFMVTPGRVLDHVSIINWKRWEPQDSFYSHQISQSPNKRFLIIRQLDDPVRVTPSKITNTRYLYDLGISAERNHELNDTVTISKMAAENSSGIPILPLSKWMSDTQLQSKSVGNEGILEIEWAPNSSRFALYSKHLNKQYVGFAVIDLSDGLNSLTAEDVKTVRFTFDELGLGNSSDTVRRELNFNLGLLDNGILKVSNIEKDLVYRLDMSRPVEEINLKSN